MSRPSAKLAADLTAEATTASVTRNPYGMRQADRGNYMALRASMDPLAWRKLQRRLLLQAKAWGKPYMLGDEVVIVHRVPAGVWPTESWGLTRDNPTTHEAGTPFVPLTMRLSMG